MNTFGRLSDRLLSLVAPRTTAAALTCKTTTYCRRCKGDGSSINRQVVRETCCDGRCRIDYIGPCLAQLCVSPS